MERIISEFRLIETDDGYRLEVKGDKGAMRQAMADWRRRRRDMMRSFPFPPFFGPWRQHRYWGGCCEPEDDEPRTGEAKKGE
ncbi:MAG TPA: hypothetical protein PLJ35_14475 [Anaerolineae bacterium]|mgnify:CR=1 FL=1|nr:hypothetical protein [Anaerolineae bacterium]HPL30706.1 hypothetical protein [Anaerolineae bacterium]